jgi:hypothetical protein
MGIKDIDLKRGRRGKDFGQGFYLSADRSQAQMMAERTVDREESGKATLITYQFDATICSIFQWMNLSDNCLFFAPHSNISLEQNGQFVYFTRLRQYEYEGRTEQTVSNRVPD